MFSATIRSHFVSQASAPGSPHVRRPLNEFDTRSTRPTDKKEKDLPIHKGQAHRLSSDFHTLASELPHLRLKIKSSPPEVVDRALTTRECFTARYQQPDVTRIENPIQATPQGCADTTELVRVPLKGGLRLRAPQMDMMEPEMLRILDKFKSDPPWILYEAQRKETLDITPWRGDGRAGCLQFPKLAVKIRVGKPYVVNYAPRARPPIRGLLPNYPGRTKEQTFIPTIDLLASEMIAVPLSGRLGIGHGHVYVIVQQRLGLSAQDGGRYSEEGDRPKDRRSEGVHDRLRHGT